MRNLLLIGLTMLAVQCSYCQGSKLDARNLSDVKGAFVKQQRGDYTNPKTGQRIGHYAIVYIIDTLQQHLLNVSVTTTDRNGEMISLYYYEQNRLVKASSGVVQNGYTVIQRTYDYDEEDYALNDKDQDAISQAEERYALFKEAKKYLAVLKR
jgi:hypothetical protein